MKKGVPKEPLLLTQLRKTDRELTRVFPGPDCFGKGLGAIGLFLDKKLSHSHYDWCTPKNCWTFGGTLGDGVHFSLLEREGAVQEDSPIVVTQPGAMGASWIVGENLHDFLSFGATRGFSPFESIDPAWRATASWRRMWAPNGQQQQILDFLVSRFKLKPWATIKRFRYLQTAYFKELDLPSPVKESYERGWFG